MVQGGPRSTGHAFPTYCEPLAIRKLPTTFSGTQPKLISHKGLKQQGAMAGPEIHGASRAHLRWLAQPLESFCSKGWRGTPMPGPPAWAESAAPLARRRNPDI